MPRPRELPFMVTLFVEGGVMPGMDAAEKQAKDFEEIIEKYVVNNSVQINRRPILAVEVKYLIKKVGV